MTNRQSEFRRRIRPGVLGLLYAGLALVSVAARATDIEEARFWRDSEYSRLVFGTDQPVEYSVFMLEDPYRVVIDVADTRLRANLDGIDFSDSPVTGIRHAVRNGDDLRVVLDLARAVNPTSFTLEPDDGLRHRLVVDLYDLDRSAPVREPQPPPETDSPRRDVVVAIDAGHGGDDPGAIGYDGRIREKDVALAISRAVFQQLEGMPGYRPIMVRSGDYFVQLQRRPQLARNNRADIFLSIHADSFRSSRAEGVTIYALSQSTAEAENNRRVAERENSAGLLGGLTGETSLAQYEEDLALTLLDLSMSWSIEQSISAGAHILDSVGRVAVLRRDKPQRANLWVLRSPDIPSLLIETGYLSNPAEARLLTSPGYQRRLADAIVHGVRSYFRATPPEGSLLAWQKVNGELPELRMPVGGEYVVRRGDSLSQIAQQHGVSLRELRSANGLRGDVIHVGQSLVIPGGGGRMPSPPSEHVITRGETLSGIASRYRVSLSRLREANNLNGDVIHVGQVLVIPAS